MTDAINSPKKTKPPEEVGFSFMLLKHSLKDLKCESHKLLTKVWKQKDNIKNGAVRCLTCKKKEHSRLQNDLII